MQLYGPGTTFYRAYILRQVNVDTPTEIGLPKFIPCSLSTSCWHVESKMLLVRATTTWSMRPVAYLTQNMSFFLASFLLVRFVCKVCNYQKSPAEIVCFTWLPNWQKCWCTLWPWKWCKNVASVCHRGKHHKQHSMILKKTWSYRAKADLQDKPTFTVKFHAVHTIIALLCKKNVVMVTRNVACETTFWCIA